MRINRQTAAFLLFIVFLALMPQAGIAATAETLQPGASCEGLAPMTLRPYTNPDETGPTLQLVCDGYIWLAVPTKHQRKPPEGGPSCKGFMIGTARPPTEKEKYGNDTTMICNGFIWKPVPVSKVCPDADIKYAPNGKGSYICTAISHVYPPGSEEVDEPEITGGSSCAGFSSGDFYTVIVGREGVRNTLWCDGKIWTTEKPAEAAVP